MTGAVTFVVTNIIAWVLITLSVPHFSWPTATLLAFPFTFIVGQLAEGLAAWRSRLSLGGAAIRGVVLSMIIALVFVATQFFGTLAIQPSDFLYVMTFMVTMVGAGTAITVLSRMAPDTSLDLVSALKAGLSLRQRPHREAVAEASAGGQGVAARHPAVPQATTPPVRPASKANPTPKDKPVSHRSVWS
ncbi:MAG: hypothetical protein ACYC6I_05020 [Bacillota bacterium]